MPRPQPHTRVRIGRDVALTGATLYAATRALAYLPGLATVTGPVGIISLNGHLLWAWSLAWAVAAVLCIVDMVRRHTRHGLSLVIGLATAWGVGYSLDWVVQGFDGREWLTAITYLGPAIISWGLLFKVTALHDLANPSGMQGAETGDAE